VKLWPRVWCLVFFDSRCSYTVIVTVSLFILIDNCFAVNDLHGYFMITAFDSDNKSILILPYLNHKFSQSSSP